MRKNGAKINPRLPQSRLRPIQKRRLSQHHTKSSQKLDVAPASVTEMLKKLSEEGYVKYSPYHGSTLTEKGLQEAQKSNPKTPTARNIPLRRLTHRKRQSPQRSLPNGTRPLRRSRRIVVPPTKTPRHLLRRRQNHPRLRPALLHLRRMHKTTQPRLRRSWETKRKPDFNTRAQRRQISAKSASSEANTKFSSAS